MSVLLQYKNDAAASAAAAKVSEDNAADSAEDALGASAHMVNIIYTNIEGAI